MEKGDWNQGKARESRGNRGLETGETDWNQGTRIRGNRGNRRLESGNRNHGKQGNKNQGKQGNKGLESGNSGLESRETGETEDWKQATGDY